VHDDTIRDFPHLSVSQGETPAPHLAADEKPDAAIIQSTGRINVGGGDENVAKIQLAARWSEHFAPDQGDSLDAALQRFQRVYHFVDSVSKLVDPNQL
jgi:hypothetical protein